MQDQMDGFESPEEIRIDINEIITHEGEITKNNSNSQRKYELPSAREISAVRHSLVPDMLSGWVPKKGVVCPVPLDFQNTVTGCIIDYLTKGEHSERIVYLGPRHHNTYTAHSAHSSSYKFKYSHVEKQAHMLAYFRGFYANFKPHHQPPFIGHNPDLPQSSLLFDSNFQSGNLDIAIRTQPDTYDLFIRIDSNTNGHCLWYSFKTVSMIRQKITFSICNLKKTATLYNEGQMSPYYLSSLETDWKQLKNPTICSLKSLRYPWLKTKFSRNSFTHLNLTFQYEFEENEQVHFAYCIPYTYSQLLRVVSEVKEAAAKNRVHFKASTLCESLSGLDIPLLSFGSGKQCILISARTHPGESNGSWMVEQIMRELSSGHHRLLEETVVKIVPMLNPDGVILGNFRSSAAGRDLNRCFCEERLIAFPEVEGLKRLVLSLKEEFRQKMTMFIDLHGHSGKKNVFVYGFDNLGSIQARVFPKILSHKTDMFRYYACNFKLTRDKKTTARASLMPYFKICYTVQASVSCYFAGGKTTIFDSQGWMKMGSSILEGLKDYLEVADCKAILRKGSVSKPIKMMKPLRRTSTFKRNIKTQKDQKQQTSEIQNLALDKYHDLFKQIKEDEPNRFEQAEQTDSETQDYSNEAQQGFFQRIVEARNLFEQAYLNRLNLNMDSPFFYNFSLHKKLTNIPRSRVVTIRHQTEVPKQHIHNSSVFMQSAKKTKYRHSFYERNLNRRKNSEQSDSSLISNFLQNTSQSIFKKSFNIKKLVQVNYGPALTFNLRLLAPQNYIRPSETPNNRKAYVGKQQLSRIRVRTNQSVH